MGITNSTKTVSARRIGCSDSFQVTLALSAAPDIVSNPADIVLVLDRSGSMAGSPLANLKSGAKTFIDIIDRATDSARDGYLGYGSRMGVVSFSTSATQDCPLTTSVSRLKEAVDGLRAKGDTNHSAAFAAAAQLFDPASSNQKILVLFTDGETTAGPDAGPEAAALRAEGVVIYCIGLQGSRGIDQATLNEWATDPDESHVAVAPSDAELSELFEDLAVNISKPGATNIVIEEEVSSDFQITSILTPSTGAASLTGPTTLVWTIGQLGVYGNEGATLEFFVRHVGSESGLKAVNEMIHYSDDENNMVTFPSPSVQVDCDLVITPETCPQPVEIGLESCRDAMEVDAGDIQISGLGRVLQISARLKNVCPGRRVALAVILSRVGPCGEENLGMKVLTLPAHSGAACRDVLVKCIPFILPEEAGLCAPRSVKARFLAQYMDSGFHCCSAET